MKTELIVEIAPFSIASGLTEAALIEASDRIEREFLSKADGYVGRLLIRKDNEEWADIVIWQSEAHASRAMQAVASSAACKSYFECMKQADHDEPQGGVSLFRAVKSYGAWCFETDGVSRRPAA